MKLIGAVLFLYILFALTTDCHPPGPRSVPVTPTERIESLEARVAALEKEKSGERLDTVEAWCQRQGAKFK